MSGQKVNLLKSTIFFSPNTTRAQRQNLSSILGMRMVDLLDNYLGLPLMVGKNKTNAFKYVVDRFTNKIKGWSKRLLSRGGKKVFIKSILQSLPTYMFSVFMLPRGILDGMVVRIRNFWWKSKKKDRGWAMLRWDDVCKPKGMGAWA